MKDSFVHQTTSAIPKEKEIILKVLRDFPSLKRFFVALCKEYRDEAAAPSYPLGSVLPRVDIRPDLGYPTALYITYYF